MHLCIYKVNCITHTVLVVPWNMDGLDGCFLEDWERKFVLKKNGSLPDVCQNLAQGEELRSLSTARREIKPKMLEP